MRMWSFSVSPHGLGLSDEQFWDSTPRIYQHLRERWKEARMFGLSMHADLKALLHNIHYRQSKSDRVWTADMFMPGYKPPPPNWEKQKEMLSMHIKKPVTTEDLAAINEGQEIFQERARRARELQKSGASPEHVRRVMDGVM